MLWYISTIFKKYRRRKLFKSSHPILKVVLLKMYLYCVGVVKPRNLILLTQNNKSLFIKWRYLIAYIPGFGINYKKIMKLWSWWSCSRFPGVRYHLFVEKKISLWLKKKTYESCSKFSTKHPKGFLQN